MCARFFFLFFLVRTRCRKRGASCEHLKLGISQKTENASPVGWRWACTISTAGGSLAGFQLLQRHRGSSAVSQAGPNSPHSRRRRRSDAACAPVSERL